MLVKKDFLGDPWINPSSWYGLWWGKKEHLFKSRIDYMILLHITKLSS